MRAGSPFQTVNRRGALLNSRFKTDGKFGNRSIVVNGFGNTNNLNGAAFAIVGNNVHTAVAADNNDGVKTEFLYALSESLGHLFQRFHFDAFV